MATTTTIKATDLVSIPDFGQMSEDIGKRYLSAAGREAGKLDRSVAKGRHALALLFHEVRSSGLALFALDSDEREAANNSEGRSTAFSRWYQSLDLAMSRQDAAALANYGRNLAEVDSNINAGQSVALDRVRKANQDPAEVLARVRAECAETDSKVTAAAIKSAAGIDQGPSKSAGETVVPTSERPTVESLPTTEDIARFLLSVPADVVTGDLSGFSATDWKNVIKSAKAIAAMVDSFGKAADRKATAPTV